MSEETKEPLKLKVSYAKLYVCSGGEKPLYGIEYRSLEDEFSDDGVHCGFASYDVELVKKWLVESFEFVYIEKTPE